MRVQGMSMDGARGDSVADTASLSVQVDAGRGFEREEAEEDDDKAEVWERQSRHPLLKAPSPNAWLLLTEEESKRLQCSITDNQETEETKARWS